MFDRSDPASILTLNMDPFSLRYNEAHMNSPRSFDTSPSQTQVYVTTTCGSSAVVTVWIQSRSGLCLRTRLGVWNSG